MRVWLLLLSHGTLARSFATTQFYPTRRLLLGADDVGPMERTNNILDQRTAEYRSSTLRYLKGVVDSATSKMGKLDDRVQMFALALWNTLRTVMSFAAYAQQRAKSDSNLMLLSTAKVLQLPVHSVGPPLLRSLQHTTTSEKVLQMRESEMIPSIARAALQESVPVRAYRGLRTLPSALQYAYALDLHPPSAVRKALRNMIAPFTDESARRKLSASTGFSGYSTLPGTQQPATEVPQDEWSVAGEMLVLSTTTLPLTKRRIDDSIALTRHRGDHGRGARAVIDTTADTNDVLEENLVRSALLLLDIALFLVEAVVRTTLPVLRDGGGRLVERFAATLRWRERSELSGLSWPRESRQYNWRLLKQLKGSTLDDHSVGKEELDHRR